MFQTLFIRKLIICGLLSVLSINNIYAQLEVSRLFSDNAVLQRDREIPIRGTASPGEKILINFNKHLITTLTDESGKWSSHLPEMKAGGPFTLTISGDTEKLVFQNLLIGDVWLCSGQSNMEWTLANVMNAEVEIANAKDSQIRHFKVPRSHHFFPQDSLTGGNWQTCSPEQAGSFTAVGYFFARSLREHHDVPIGLLHSSWGGSRIEPWMRAELLGYNDAIESAKVVKCKMDSTKNQTIYALESKLGTLPSEDMGMKNDFPIWASTDYNHNSWNSMELPGTWESRGYEKLDGVVWFRKEVFLTLEESKYDLIINLGTIDNADITYFNGQKIGESDSPNLNRKYIVKAELLKPGSNVLTVRVHDKRWSGGFTCRKEDFFYQSNMGKKSLCGNWNFKIGIADMKHMVLPNQFPTLLYNQMIHPLINFPIKGVIWYQGEYNAGYEDAVNYQKQFPALINDWRKLWNSGDFPFLWVQLANWQEASDEPADHGWARLREAQSMTLSLPNTAQAVTIDIGDPNDIHPRNKQDVGYRLALGARKIAYNEDLVHSGPLYTYMEIAENTIKLNFELFGGSLASTNNKELKAFEVAGADRKFHWAQAKIVGNQVIVQSEKVKNPLAVRYAWSINPEKANLGNKEGLPASPFRTDDW